MVDEPMEVDDGGDVGGAELQISTTQPGVKRAKKRSAKKEHEDAGSAAL